MSNHVADGPLAILQVDSGVFVIKGECCKIQQTLLSGPWTGRTIIVEKCDELRDICRVSHGRKRC